MTRYLVTFLIAGLLLTLLTATFNYTVNPFGLFESPLDLKKTQAYSRGRILKAHLPLAIEIDTLLVGNSRVELGLSPNHPGLKMRNAYNLGLPGADISMQSNYAFNVLQNQSVEELIMSVDFVDFLFTDDKRYRHAPETYTARLRSNLIDGHNKEYFWNKTKDLSAALLSLDALASSLTTILSQNSQLSYMEKNGKMFEGEFIGIVENEGIGVLFEQKENNLREKFGKDGWRVAIPGTSSSDHFDNFKSLISKAIETNTKISLFISPLHRNYLHLLEDTEKLSMFMRWKKLLIQNLQEVGFFKTGQLWDFSIPSKYTNEDVPDRNVKGVYMKWYWEPAHYRSALGDKILDTLLFAENPWGQRIQPPLN